MTFKTAAELAVKKTWFPSPETSFEPPYENWQSEMRVRKLILKDCMPKFNNRKQAEVEGRKSIQKVRMICNFFCPVQSLVWLHSYLHLTC